MAVWQIFDKRTNLPVTGVPDYDDGDYTVNGDEGFEEVRARAMDHVKQIDENYVVSYTNQSWPPVDPSDEPPAEDPQPEG